MNAGFLLNGETCIFLCQKWLLLLRLTSLIVLGILEKEDLDSLLFGSDFLWGTATAAYQIEGATDIDGRGPCIWDKFAKKPGSIKNGDHAETACNFYYTYESDLALIHELGFKQFRFSISWSRVLPLGVGTVNSAGIDFYQRVIDKCLALGLEPWLTLYHWDLPQALEDKGGWRNRDVVEWFSEYTALCVKEFGEKVRYWIVMNEPMATAGLGYTQGMHAPGKKSLVNFLPVAHHLAMCQAEAGRAIRAVQPNAKIGTALSCSFVAPATQDNRDVRAAQRADAVLNRLFIEPALGMGYPTDVFPFLKRINKYIKPGDLEKLAFDFDFIGLQNYFKVVVKHSYMVPVLWLKEIPAIKRNMPVTALGWEVAPDGMYQILKQFSAYKNIPDLIVSENGAAFEDSVVDGKVQDIERIAFFKSYLRAILKAKQEGVRVKGYFAWTSLDNFEWAVGFSVRFGLIHVDFSNQKRIIKQSGVWFKQFLGKVNQ